MRAVSFFSFFFHVHWVFPRSVKHALEGWKDQAVGKRREEAWIAGPLCLFWTVWKVRNKIVFEDVELSIQNLKSSFVYNLWSETKMCLKDSSETLVEFIDWLNCW